MQAGTLQMCWTKTKLFPYLNAMNVWNNIKQQPDITELSGYILSFGKKAKVEKRLCSNLSMHAWKDLVYRIICAILRQFQQT